jgi:hypothetical protein
LPKKRISDVDRRIKRRIEEHSFDEAVGTVHNTCKYIVHRFETKRSLLIMSKY